MVEPNCEDCVYRRFLAKFYHTRDCDKYGTDFCKKMVDPDFIKFVLGNEGK